jgi:hypothetical protein
MLLVNKLHGNYGIGMAVLVGIGAIVLALLAAFDRNPGDSDDGGAEWLEVLTLIRPFPGDLSPTGRAGSYPRADNGSAWDPAQLRRAWPCR